jgi:DNA-binding MarR family transcriptional regulator
VITDDEFTLWVDFVLSHTHVTRFVDGALRRECGIGFSTYDVLYNLAAHAPEPLTAGQIGDAILYSSGSVTNLLNRLAQAGLVERVRSTADRRVSSTHLTEHGWTVYSQATDVLLRAVRDSFTGRLAPGELKPVAAFLARLHASDTTLRQPPYQISPGLG